MLALLVFLAAAPIQNIEVRGNKTVAAQILGFDRRTLYRKLESYAEPA